MQVERKAKTRKGKKILEKLLPQIEEGPKKTIIFKHNKTSEVVTQFLKDIYMYKKDNTLVLGKRFDIKPFEDVSKIEHFCNKNDCGLFIFGSHQKKRPNNIIIGRIFNETLLDMFELGINNFQSQANFKNTIDIPLHAKPCLFFQGDLFEYDAIYIRLKNLLLDIFVENVPVNSIDISKEFTHVICFSANEKYIYMRVYSVTIKQQQISQMEKEQTIDAHKLDKFFDMKMIGPNCEFVLRRQQFAPDDVFKQACKQFKKKVKKEEKNISHDNLGQKRGRVYLDQQDLQTLSLKKRKKIKLHDQLEQKKQKKMDAQKPIQNSQKKKKQNQNEIEDFEVDNDNN